MADPCTNLGGSCDEEKIKVTGYSSKPRSSRGQLYFLAGEILGIHPINSFFDEVPLVDFNPLQSSGPQAPIKCLIEELILGWLILALLLFK
jgi:hypothetical protein